MGRLPGSKNKKPYPKNAATQTQRMAANMSKTGTDLNIVKELCGGDEELLKIYRKAAVNVLQNPVMQLARDRAELEIRKIQKERLDKEKGIHNPLDPLVLKAVDLSMKATKLQIDAQKVLNKYPKGRKIMKEVDDTDVIEADFDALVNGPE